MLGRLRTPFTLSSNKLTLKNKNIFVLDKPVAKIENIVFKLH